MTLPGKDPPPGGRAGPARVIPVRAAPRQAAAPGTVHVEDHLESRVRIPADLLRCVIALIEIGLLVGLGLLARATAKGAEIDIVLASQRLPAAVLSFVGFAAHVALLILPVVLAIRLLVRRQPRRLGEGVVAGGLTVALVLILNLALRNPAATALYDVLTAKHTPTERVPALDWYLSGLTAYVTVIGLTGRPRWRGVFWLAIGFYAVASLADTQTTVFSLLITLLLGIACGAGLRYALGAISERPSATEIAGALATVSLPVTAMRRIVDPSAETRRYAALLRGGGGLDLTVFDRDQQAADLLYRLYRRVRLRTQVSRSAPLTVERALERQALLTYAAEDAGVPTPRLRALIRAGPEAAVLAHESHDGTTLAVLADTATDAQLAQIWDVVLRLHSRRVTHRALTADRILLTGAEHDHDDGQAVGLGRPHHSDDGVMLLEPGNGDVAASDLQLRLDLAQLLAELALVVGPERAARSALGMLSPDEVAAVVPLIQPVALHRSTRAAVHSRKDVLPALRKILRATAPGPDTAPVRLERIRLRNVMTLVAAVFAVYILAVDLTKTSFSSLLHHANWGWTVVALGLSALTYVGASWSLSGFVLERLRLVRTLIVQVACSFVTLVTPAAVGGATLNVRYLRRAKVAPADAVASVGVSQVIALTLHLILLVIFAALTGTVHGSSIQPPDWVYIVLAVLASAALVVLAVPAGRRVLLSRLTTTLGQVIPRLLEIAQRPAKLAEGIGGALLVTLAYIGCLAVSVRAFGGSLSIVAVAVVYLTGNAIGSAVPIPGGIGTVDAALSAGLTAAGLHSAVAFSSVLLFRTVTFWLPVPVGWVALSYLQRQDAL
ncbi:MAG TPA: lysylphosphatidylglycerol synthase transmembrane domain-containing protein [Streptosporangiaceae bacterium]|nr:lysylphosphatidylglycerol synthase transmembrane domain-containing protein [Streptosporangiaceae bacterium]